MIDVYTGSKSVGQKPNAFLCVYTVFPSLGAYGVAPVFSGHLGPVFDS